jgi:hypothetical protein
VAADDDRAAAVLRSVREPAAVTADRNRAVATELHRSIADLEMPPRIARLPLDRRGYPVPWFVAYIDREPDFRVVRPRGVDQALSESRCWICGQLMLDTRVAYVVGPMCAVNRTSAEPPSHRDCARYAARACPFLTRPHARRRENNLPENGGAPGLMIRRNPGVALVWITRQPLRVFEDGRGGRLFDIGEPVAAEWYAEGRSATRAEVMASIESGLPILRAEAEKDGADACAALDGLTANAMEIVPA